MLNASGSAPLTKALCPLDLPLSSVLRVQVILPPGIFQNKLFAVREAAAGLSLQVRAAAQDAIATLWVDKDSLGIHSFVLGCFFERLVVVASTRNGDFGV